MKRSRDRDLEQGLSKKEFWLIVLITMLLSTIIIWNFPDGPRLSPFSWSATRVTNIQSGIGDVPTLPPTRPVNVDATDDNSLVIVTWDEPLSGGEVECYNVYRTDQNVFPSSPILPLGTITIPEKRRFIDYSLNPGDAKYYWVSACNGAGESPVSQFNRGVVSATIKKQWWYPGTISSHALFPYGVNFGSNGNIVVSNNGQNTYSPNFPYASSRFSFWNANAIGEQQSSNDVITHTSGSAYHFVKEFDSADNADVSAHIMGISNDPNSLRIQKFTSSSSAPDFEYFFPIQSLDHGKVGVVVSDDGRYIIGFGYDSSTFNTHLATLDTTLPNPENNPVFSNNIFFGSPSSPLTGLLVRNYELSNSGSLFAIGQFGNRVYFFNPLTGEQKGYLLSGLPFDISMSDDESIIAASVNAFNDQVKVLENPIFSGGFMQPSYSLDISTMIPIFQNGFAIGDAVEVSPSGDKIAIGYRYYGEDLVSRLGIIVWDISQSSKPIIFQDEIVSLAGNSNYPVSLRFSNNENRLALGMAGDNEFDDTEHIFVFDLISGSLAASFFEEGLELSELDFSSDGSKIAAAYQEYTGSTSGWNGEIVMYDIPL